jgi:hypothetical protein
MGQLKQLLFSLSAHPLLVLLFLLFEEGLTGRVEIRAVSWLDVAKVVDGKIEADVAGGLSFLFGGALALTSGFFLQFVQQSVHMGNPSDFLLLGTVADDVLHIRHPLMSQNVLESYPLLRIKLQNVSDEILERVGKGIAQLIAASQHPLFDFAHRIPAKRGMTVHHFVEQYSQRPNINAVVVAAVEEHFRRHVLISAAEGRSWSADVFSAPAEVTEFEVVGVVEQQVLGLSGPIYTLISRCMMSNPCR